MFQLTFDEKIALIEERAALIGYIPLIEEKNSNKIIQFKIYSCPFRNHLPEYPEIVCSLHEAYLRGQINALFSHNEFIQTENMLHTCQHCKYEIQVK